MPLMIEDDAVAELVTQFAARRGLSSDEALRVLVLDALAGDDGLPMHERIAAWRAAHPLPPPTGLKADKAFFDDLSGDP